ncbi:CHAT domain-containing protein [Microbacterium memoriense]|uniref:CHAT domain-containing protein n=1 Tax=Microbacterium memoriense TaxID=2978350 RepID=A0ABT2PB09_9MICO|nr:CHAT domain-containing protein [Microbacterium memoriense]MCT9001767.1 CHAT domain-containing protein [Microbacterium memoriense]
MTSPDEREYARGLDLAAQRRFAEALVVLDAVAATAHDPDLYARVVGTRAYIFTQTGRSADGERECRAALEDDRLSAHTRGVVAGQLGSVLVNQGRLDEGLQWLGLAIDTIPDDPLAVANLRVNRSLIHMQRRDLPQSAADLQATLAVFADHGSASDLAEAQHNLGYVALLEGDLVRAMREMAAARPVLAALSSANAAICDADRAEVLRDAGLATEAERVLAAAAASFGADGMPQARAESELRLAISLVRHDPGRAERVARTAARRFRALGAGSWATRADGVRLRAALSVGGMDQSGQLLPVHRRRPDDDEIDRVARALSRHGFAGDAAALRLARELWRARQGKRAGRMPAITDHASLDVRLLAREVRARRAEHTRPARARAEAAAGLAELGAGRSVHGSLDLQTSLAMHGQALLLAGIDSAVASGRPDVIFEWSERARLLSQQVVAVRPPHDPAQAADLSELRMLRADLAGSDWLADPRVIALGARVRERQWQTAGAARDDAVDSRLDLDALRATLAPDTAVLSYVYGTAGLRCLVATSTGASLVSLPGWEAARTVIAGLRADLDMTATVRTGPLAAVVQRSLQQRLALLSRALVDEPVRVAGVRRLVVTAPGILAGIPWSMVPGLAECALTLAGSASRWALSEPRPLRTAAFAVGPRIDRGVEEVTTAAAVWDSPHLLLGPAATVEATSAVAGEADVLHIVAHGRHAADNPLFSGLELSDGVLFGYDIDRIAAIPRTVVLSACEVGRSAVRWGEEAIGMTRAWLHAGADCVIAAPVVVADDDASAVLSALHSGLAAGRSPAEALAAAQAETGILTAFQCHGAGL